MSHPAGLVADSRGGGAGLVYGAPECVAGLVEVNAAGWSEVRLVESGRGGSSVSWVGSGRQRTICLTVPSGRRQMISGLSDLVWTNRPVATVTSPTGRMIGRGCPDRSRWTWSGRADRR